MSDAVARLHNHERHALFSRQQLAAKHGLARGSLPLRPAERAPDRAGRLLILRVRQKGWVDHRRRGSVGRRQANRAPALNRCDSQERPTGVAENAGGWGKPCDDPAQDEHNGAEDGPQETSLSKQQAHREMQVPSHAAPVKVQQAYHR